MSTPNHRRHFGALGATASGIKVSSGGRELLSGIDSGTTLSLGGSRPTAGDPVASGIVPRLDRPSGNITGFAANEASLGGKWLELLSEIAPGPAAPTAMER